MKWKPSASSRSPERQSSGKRDLILMLVPALILTVVGLNQAVAHASEGLSAWKGGGFGMFSGVDRDYTRVFRGQITDQAGNTVMLDMDTVDQAMASGFNIDFQQHYENVRSYPTDAHLQAFIDILGAAQWTRSDDGKTAEVTRWNSGGVGTFRSSTFDLQLYQITYDKATNMVTPALVTSYQGKPNG